jgi:plastocyanin
MILAPLAGCTSSDDGTDTVTNNNSTDDGNSGGTGGTGGTDPTTHSVDINGFAFNPSQLTIAVGDTVTWTNSDSTSHTATADDGTFDSGNLANGDTFSFTFTEAGTFSYTCSYHSSMTGSITVE